MFFLKSLFILILMGSCILPQSLFAKPRGSMVHVPGGSFVRGDGKTVRVNDFSILATEISWSTFKEIRDWATNSGYDFEEGIGQDNLPAQNITWFDAIKWCNALSERNGRIPAYYTDDIHTSVYRRGRANLTTSKVNWDSNGYRLPTEAEWEHAYRAGTTTNYYWGDFKRSDKINHQYAAFHEWGNDEIDGGPITVASKKPNRFGIYDMAGNVEEWVWDRYALNYQDVGAVNPRGPDMGALRVLRGGGFVIDRIFSADARHPTYPYFVNCDIGMRVASSDPMADFSVQGDSKSNEAIVGEPKVSAQIHKVLDERANTDMAACNRLIPLLNLKHENLQTFRIAYEKKDYSGALTTLRDLYCQRLESSEFEPWLSEYVDYEEAERWLNIYRKRRRVRWTGPAADISSPTAFIAEDQLARAFVKSNKREYADAYLWMVNEAALFAKPVWNRLTKAEKGSMGKPRDSFYGFIGFNAGDPLKPFISIAWMLKHGLPKEVIPPRTLANALHSAVVDRLGAGLQDDRSAIPNQAWSNAVSIIEFAKFFDELKDASFLLAEGVSRVRKSMGTTMPDGSDLEASLNYNKMLFENCEKVNQLYPDRKMWPAWLKELNLRTDYRYLMYASLATPFATYPGVGNQQATDLSARNMLSGWFAEGKLNGLESALKPLLASAPVAKQQRHAPAFTSIGLPYGGYYVQRSGWTSKDLYLFMRSSRDGVGHNHLDNNNIQVAAYGAWLLVDSGSPAYGPTFLPEHQKKYYHYFGEHSLGNVFHANSLSIDGLAQGEPFEKVASPTDAWQEPIPNLLHHCESFDLAEGIFDGWYESESAISDKKMDELITDHGSDEVAEIVAYNRKLKNQPSRKLRAHHRRLIVFVKPDNFWILVDKVDGGSDFTQTWNFPPAHENSSQLNSDLNLSKEDLILSKQMYSGYTSAEVQSDEKKKFILTSSTNRPNIAILNFTPAPIKYRKHFGHMFPFRGWHSYAISGEKVPSVQFESTWQGNSPIVTALYPMKVCHTAAESHKDCITGFKDLSRQGISGFTYVANEATVTCKTSREPAMLEAGPIRAAAGFLLLRENVTSGLAGIALDCSQIAVAGGRSQQLRSPNVGFKFYNGQWQLIPINAPTKFRWVQTDDDQLKPEYE